MAVVAVELVAKVAELREPVVAVQEVQVDLVAQMVQHLLAVVAVELAE